ncbi:MAG TPA: cysteine desulfurase family protein [Bacteroidota bacterium]
MELRKPSYISSMQTTVRRVYLDHTATTPLDPGVFEAMKPFFSGRFGNASSIHHFGREARAALDESRDTLARLIGAQSGEVFFVSGGTEANNFALKGAGRALMARGRNHIITDKSEHHAVLEPCAGLEQTGFEVTYLDVDGSGRVKLEDLRAAIRPQTGLISVMHANNEVGTINPVAGVARIAKAQGILVHSDAVQSFGKIPVNVDLLGVDLLSLSAHKIYGPKGIGALYVRKGIEIERYLHGGGQERGRRAGTENVPGAVGFAEAAAAMQRQMEAERQRLVELKDRLRSSLRERHPWLLFNGDQTPSGALSHILSVSFDSERIRIDGEALLFNLDLAGIAVTSGSACTSGSMEPSHVLLAMGRDPATAKAAIRFSMGRSTTEEDIDYTAGVLTDIVERIGQKVSS